MTLYPKVPYKRLDPDMPEPKYAHAGDAGFDLCATEDVRLMPGESKKIGCGFAFAIPDGFVGLVFARSGLGMRGLVMKNGTGVIDSTYRGEVGLTLYNNNPLITLDVIRRIVNRRAINKECRIDFGENAISIHKGDRVAQMVVVPIAQCFLSEVETLSETERGEDGFGSSGMGRL